MCERQPDKEWGKVRKVISGKGSYMKKSTRVVSLVSAVRDRLFTASSGRQQFGGGKNDNKNNFP